MKRLCMVAVLSLAGCASTPPPQIVTKIQFVQPDIPSSLLTCAPEPDAPATDMQGDAVRYMVLLRGAWLDCSDHLKAVGAALADPDLQPEK
jgi:hypothetical protein